MIKPSESMSLFPVLVNEYDLRDYYDKDELRDLLYKVIKQKKTGYWWLFPESISSYSGSEDRDGDDMFLYRMPELMQKVMGCINDYARQAGFKTQTPVNSWFNIAAENAEVKPHRHDGCNISCTFYPIFPTGSANLILHKPMKSGLRPEDQFTSSYNGKDSMYNISEYELTIKEGHLYVWPSWMVHSAKGNLSGERVMIALNTVNKGQKHKKITSG